MQDKVFVLQKGDEILCSLQVIKDEVHHHNINDFKWAGSDNLY